MDGLSAEGILHDDDLVFAQGLFDRGVKGFLRAVPLHVGLPGKNEQVLGMVLGACAQDEQQREKN